MAQSKGVLACSFTLAHWVLGRCDRTLGCCLEAEHSGDCNDGNMSDQDYEVESITAEMKRTVRGRSVTVYRVKWKG